MVDVSARPSRRPCSSAASPVVSPRATSAVRPSGSGLPGGAWIPWSLPPATVRCPDGGEWMPSAPPCLEVSSLQSGALSGRFGLLCSREDWRLLILRPKGDWVITSR